MCKGTDGMLSEERDTGREIPELTETEMDWVKLAMVVVCGEERDVRIL